MQTPAHLTTSPGIAFLFKLTRVHTKEEGPWKTSMKENEKEDLKHHITGVV